MSGGRRAGLRPRMEDTELSSPSQRCRSAMCHPFCLRAEAERTAHLRGSSRATGSLEVRSPAGTPQ
eukprot:4702691-Alexandrium_andersonii.AAC.1